MELMIKRLRSEVEDLKSEKISIAGSLEQA
jgi:hypothetical protein